MSFQQILDKGSSFERLMQAYLRTAPQFHFQQVWLWNDRADLGGVDTGIDLAALTAEPCSANAFRRLRSKTSGWLDTHELLFIQQQIEIEIFFGDLKIYGNQEISIIQLYLAKLRRTAGRHGCQPVQGLCAGAALYEICL